jgi:hypothetical protein
MPPAAAATFLFCTAVLCRKSTATAAGNRRSRKSIPHIPVIDAICKTGRKFICV